MPNLPSMSAINPPVLVPATREKRSLGVKPSGRRPSCWLTCCIRRFSMIREERPRTPPPSRVRMLVVLDSVEGIEWSEVICLDRLRGQCNKWQEQKRGSPLDHCLSRCKQIMYCNLTCCLGRTVSNLHQWSTCGFHLPNATQRILKGRSGTSASQLYCCDGISDSSCYAAE